MNVLKCKNGHFFDGDKYDKCPHCGENAEGGVNKGAALNLSEKKGVHSGKKEKNTTDVIDDNNAKSKQDQQAPKIEHTLDFWQTTSDGNVSLNDKESPKSSDIYVGDERSLEKIDLNDYVETNNSNTSSLKDAIQKASANTEGKTMSYFSSATSAASNEKSDTTANISAEPVVGWLVCIGGNHFGESFNIGAGKNSIGRNGENKIILTKDNKISRVKHALITYEPKKRNFYLQPGDSSGLTYLNDDYIDESKKLSSRDVIELGDSKFIFVPLCDETFSWEDYLRKE